MLTLEQKLAILQFWAVKEFNLSQSSFSECCGAVDMRTNPVEHISWGNRIRWKFSGPEETIPIPTKSSCLLLPDASGNLHIEWNDA